MATASKVSNKKRALKSARSRYIGKPAGLIQERVQAVGPTHFGIISVDCAKRRSKWMLCDFYGKVLIEPATVEHNAGALKAMTDQLKGACQELGIKDSIAAVEMTGIYHRPVQVALRKAGFDTRTVHPFASKHYRKPLHPDIKTDDNDLEAIFHAAINGYGLSILPVDDTYKSLQATARHRRNLVKQRARLQVQIRALMHQTMPGFADLFVEDKLFNGSIAIPIAKHYSSASLVARHGADGMAKYLKQEKIRFQSQSLDRIAAWAATAAEPSPLAAMLTTQWKQLDELRAMLTRQIKLTEVDREAILFKLREFHRVHGSPIQQTVADMTEAFQWLPKSTYASEAKPLSELVGKRQRGTSSIGNLLLPLLIRLGVNHPETVESEPSEA